MRDQVTRREVLRSASLLALASFLPASLRGADLLRTVTANRALVVFEFNGGNDGLNTVVPYLDTTYNDRRPSLKLTVGNTDWRKEVIPFSTFSAAGQGAAFKPAGLGVHAGLRKLQDAWQAGDFAIINGVGYANPNRSHFRGIDIWHNAATDDQVLPTTGWLARMFAADGLPPGYADAVMFNRANENPLHGGALRLLSMTSPADFLSLTNDLTDPSDALLASITNPALKHLMLTQRTARQARAALVTAVGTPPAFATAFPDNEIGTQAKYVAQCIAGGLQCPIYKIALGGFDNHANQVNKHADLMAQTADALRALRAALIEKGRWNDVVVMSYSEFGRRIEENNSAGTDHGTAAPHFLLGGRVAGGVYGAYPSLTDRDSRGDLKFTTDFRRLYATVAGFLGLSQTTIDRGLDPPNNPAVTTYPSLGCIA